MLHRRPLARARPAAAANTPLAEAWLSKPILGLVSRVNIDIDASRSNPMVDLDGLLHLNLGPGADAQ